MNTFTKLMLLPIVFFAGNMLLAQPQPLTLERIWNSRDFTPQRFGPARWLDDGAGYTTLEEAQEGLGNQIVRYDSRSGKRTVLVSAARLTPSGESSALQVADYQWSADKQRLLIFTNTTKVWRDNTRGDYWVLSLKDGKLQKLGGNARPSSLMFAKFSPDARRVGYVRDRNIYVQNLSDEAIIQLTDNGCDSLINGTSDWVYEEEFGLRDAFSWSPDGQQIAYWQFNTSGVGTFYMINNTDSLYPRLIPLEYPKVGTTNSASRVGVISSSGGPTVWQEMEGDPRNNYLPRMEWAAGSDELLIQHMNRLQNRNRLLLGNAGSGKNRVLMTEEDAAWVDIHDDLKWFDGGRQFTWLSERDGWRHLYLVSRHSGEARLITPGEFDIISIVSIDDKNGWIYYLASPENATQRYLYRSHISKPGKPQRLTPAGQSGTHSYQIAPGGKWAFHTWSSFEKAPVISLISLPDHRVVRVLEDNAAVNNRFAGLARKPVEFFRIEIEGDVQLDAWALYPPDFDPARKYPLFFYVYGEPAGQTVLDRWGGDRNLWFLYLAQQGYIVMSVDNRGTPGPRGREWRKQIYRQIGILASADQAAATRALIQARPYIDSQRIGIWGWSGGGQMTLNAMFRYPDLYHTGMAVSFVSDQRLYDTIYQERFMGLPDDNAEGYEQGSPITHARNLQGNLLIIHGTGDDNVHYQSFERLINKLVENNKTFSMMSYPNRSHSINEGKNTRLHLFTLMSNYLRENLPAGAR